MRTFHLNRSRTSTYVCHACGKRTRETGLGEMGLDLCAYCFEVASNENSLSDGYMSEAEFEAVMAKLNKKYGRAGAAWHEEKPAKPAKSAAEVSPEIAAKRSAAARKANETRKAAKAAKAAAASAVAA